MNNREYRYYNLTQNPNAKNCRSSLIMNVSNISEKTVKKLRSLKIIRVLFDRAPGLGNQAASTNIIKRMRGLGFEGVIELIYSPDVKHKVELFFNVKIDNSDVMNDTLNIRFISADLFSERRVQQTIDSIPFGVTGALDFFPAESYYRYVKFPIPKSLPADFLNVKVFLQFSSHHGNHPYIADEVDTRIVLRSHPYPIVQVDTRYQTLLSTKSNNNQAIQEYLVKFTQLRDLLSAVDKKEIYILPIYGFAQGAYAYNLLNLLLGARYAQLHGLNKPLIVSLLHDLPVELLANINKLLFSKDWTSLSRDFIGSIVARIQKEIHDLSLEKSFQVKTLTEITSQNFSSWNNDSFVMVSTGKLPQYIFEYFYTYNSSNMLPPIFEGASTFRLLLNQSDRPHLYCGGIHWPLNVSSIGLDMQYRFSNLTENTCTRPEAWLSSWKQQSIAELIGRYFLDAQNPASEIAKFFENHHKEALSTDRIMSGLVAATQLIDMNEDERLKILEPCLYSARFTDSNRKSLVITRLGKDLELKDDSSNPEQDRILLSLGQAQRLLSVRQQQCTIPLVQPAFIQQKCSLQGKDNIEFTKHSTFHTSAASRTLPIPTLDGDIGLVVVGVHWASSGFNYIKSWVNAASYWWQRKKQSTIEVIPVTQQAFSELAECVDNVREYNIQRELKRVKQTFKFLKQRVEKLQEGRHQLSFYNQQWLKTEVIDSLTEWGNKIKQLNEKDLTIMKTIDQLHEDFFVMKKALFEVKPVLNNIAQKPSAASHATISPFTLFQPQRTQCLLADFKITPYIEANPCATAGEKLICSK